MVHELIGVTGWTYGYISTLTMPQFFAALGARGRMLRPSVQAMLDVQRAVNLSDRKGSKGEPSGVDQVLDEHARRKKGEVTEPTLEQRRFTRAIGVILQTYRGDPDAHGVTADPFPGMSAREARALIEWVREGRCPPDVWARTLLPNWDGIVAAADAAPP